MIPEDFDEFQATSSADSNRPTGAVGNSRNNRRNDGSASAAFGKEGAPSFSTTAMRGEESTLYLQQQQQQQQQQSLEFIIPTECDFVGAKKNSGKHYYQRLINRYAELYFNEKANSLERNIIARTVADAFHYASESEMEATATRTPKKRRRRRFLKRVACIAKPGTVVTHPSKNYRYVENNDKEIDSRIKKAFLEMQKTAQKPNHPQQHHHPGKFVPRLKSPVKVKKKIPRDGTSSKLKHLFEQQQERQQQHLFHRQSSNKTNGVVEQQQPRQQDQQQQQQHLHYQQGLKILDQKGAQKKSSVAASLKKTGISEGYDCGAAPRTQSKPNALHAKAKSKKATRKVPSKAPKKVLPARKKKPVTKIRPPQRRQNNPAAKKAPPPSATQPVGETAPKNKSTSPNLFDATSTTTAKSDLDTAANVLMGLKIAPETHMEVHPIGTRTKKYFEEFQGWFQGTIRSYNKMTKFYSVEYEDSDKEDLEHHEIDTGSLRRPKYDRGTQYEVFLVSKDDGAKIGWFVGTIQSKYYHKPKKTRARGKWRYNVVYNDGDSEDVDEGYITNSINLARNKVGRKNIEPPEEKKKSSPVAVICKNPPPKAAQQPLESSCEQPIENETENTEASSSESDDSSSEEEEDDESSSEDESDPNPNNIPHWTGKQHQQFIVGLRKYGLGNLEDIHEADCIPSRSFRELIRYWRWYASDLEQKGLVLIYEAKGTVNGRKGTQFFLDDIDDEEEKEEDCDGGLRSGKWTKKEREMIAKSCISNGHTYEAMSAFIKTRNPMQVKSYFNRHKMRVMRDKLKYIKEGGIDQTNGDGGAASPSEKSSSAPGSEKRSWTPGEHVLLSEAFAMYGRDFKEMAAYMKSRSRPQISGYMKRNDKSITKNAEAKEKLYKNIAKRTGAWNACELSMLVEGHAIFYTDFERIAHYVKTRNADQVKYILEANASQYKDESAFDLGDHFAFPIELYHVLNVASFEGFDHIISWDDDGGFVLIHDNDQFANKIFPKYSHKGTSVQKFYNNLKLFGFQEFENKKKNVKGAFHHPAFQRGHSKKVERHCRKLFE